jgi:flagellar hook assembly protein FlgD
MFSKNPRNNELEFTPTFETSLVEICIYNLKGQMVRNIESSELAKGKTSFVWDGKTDDGRAVSQGIYICKIKSPNNVLTKKLIVIK